MNLTRRNLLRGLLAGSAFAGASLVGTRAPVRLAAPGARLARLPSSVGTFERLQYALLRNKVLTLGGTEARADDTNGPHPIVVHVKVMNQMHAPMLFALGTLEGGAIRPKNRAWASKAPSSAADLVGEGIDMVHPDPRFGALRFNKWFGDMLMTGKVGGALDAAPASVATRVGPFPAQSQVSVHGFVGIDSNVTHTYNNFLFSEAASSAGAGGDLLYHAVTTGLVQPPLGITVFNMGGDKENTGGLEANSVLNGSRAVVAGGRSVSQLTGVLQSAISQGLLDNDLVRLFDAVGQAGFPTERKSDLREELLANRQQLVESLLNLTTVAAIEGQTQTLGAGNSQGVAAANTARSEFLAQCAWVADAINIPDQPLRAFCLDLHVSDIDGQPFDSGEAPSAAGPALSYVEGMRQLAIGLNILAQVVAAKGHVYVLVSTEGGRDEGGGDSVAPSGLLLAPGTAVTHGLRDGFYAPAAALDTSANELWVADPSSMPLEWAQNATLSGPPLVTFAGTAQPADRATNMDIMHGLLHHLATVRGVPPTTNSSFGNRVRLNPV